jgi:hypothetical protein
VVAVFSLALKQEELVVVVGDDFPSEIVASKNSFFIVDIDDVHEILLSLLYCIFSSMVGVSNEY